MIAWTSLQFATFVESCLGFLQRYEALEIGSQARLQLVLDFEATSPVTFPLRVEPRRTLVSLIGEAIAVIPATVYDGIERCIRQSARWGTDDLYHFLLLLVEIKQPLPGPFVFLALTRLEAFDRSEQDHQIAALLIGLVPRDGSSVLSMLERLRRDELLFPNVLESAMRILATSDPGQLSIFFELFQEAIGRDDDVASTQFVLNDLVDRAGAFTVLKAICVLDPQICPTIFKAAFGTDTPLYVLNRQVARDILVASTHVECRGEVFNLETLGQKPRQEDWQLRVRLATGSLPRIVIWDDATDLPDTILSDLSETLGVRTSRQAREPV